MKRYRTGKRGSDIAVLDAKGNLVKRFPSQGHADIHILALNFPKAWQERVAAALPGRLSPEPGAEQVDESQLKKPSVQTSYRSALTVDIAECIETWHSRHPLVAPYRDKIEQLAKEAKQVRSSLNRLDAKLQERFKDDSLGEQSTEGSFRGILGRAISSLDAWLPNSSRPPDFAPDLVSSLKVAFQRYCGGRTRGFDKLLDVLQQPETQRILSTHRAALRLSSLKASSMQGRIRSKARKAAKK